MTTRDKFVALRELLMDSSELLTDKELEALISYFLKVTMTCCLDKSVLDRLD